MKKIDFEAHFVTDEFVQAFYANKGFPRLADAGPTKDRRMYFSADSYEPFSEVLLGNLLDVGQKRLEIMDAAGVDVQVVTLTAPGVEQLDPKVAANLSFNSNNALAKMVESHPDRFVGYASLAVQDPEGAARELERATKELGLTGWKTHSNYGSFYPDHPQYRPIFAKAAELDIPVYLHPTLPHIKELGAYGLAMAGAPFGFGVDTAMSMLRLIYSGLFDEFPNLKIILGHLGETLPYILKRIDFAYLRPHFKESDRPQLKKRPSEYILSNVWVTTSGMDFKPALDCAKAALGIERIMLGSDFPYEDPVHMMEFLNASGLSDEDRDKLFGKNAVEFGFAKS